MTTLVPPRPTTAAPERSLVQRMEALYHANEIRTKRAALKRELKTGRASIHAVLLEPPEFVETAKVFDILLAVPKYGRVKANKVLQFCRISPSKTIGGLSQRQRAELISMLGRTPSQQRRTHRTAPDDLTDFEAEVLAFACRHDSVGPSVIDAAARQMSVTPAQISRSRGELRRRGLLDDFDEPTAAGRARSSLTTHAATAA